MKLYDDYLRWLYRSGRPNRFARLQNRASTVAFAAGIWPKRTAALEVLGYAAPARPLREVLDIGPRIDLMAIQYRYARTSRVLRAAARRGYDTYLKANRVEKGVDSYDAVVQLILGAVLDDQGFPRRR